LGDKPGKVRVGFETGGINDRMEIRHGSKYVASTCPTIPDNNSYPRCTESSCFIVTGQNSNEYEFYFDPALGPFIEVIVLGWCGNSNTEWRINVGCP
jgi:hypothetical protein